MELGNVVVDVWLTKVCLGPSTICYFVRLFAGPSALAMNADLQAVNMIDKGTDNQASPFNLDELNELYGQETVFELLHMSVDEGTGLLKQIDDGINAHDARMIMAGAHQLKGLASTMTINRLSIISLELESAAREEHWEQIAEVQNRLCVEFKVVADYIARLLQAAGK
jgi:HPt (histidine-containing phosphotransfer) domain-containing protein